MQRPGSARGDMVGYMKERGSKSCSEKAGRLCFGTGFRKLMLRLTFGS